jgi:alpha-glucosidase
LAGNIGKNISVARRKGDIWFVGNAAGLDPWNTTLPLTFLSKGKKYLATIYEDDGHDTIRKSTIQVNNIDKLPLTLLAQSGNALIIRPIK